MTVSRSRPACVARRRRAVKSLPVALFVADRGRTPDPVAVVRRLPAGVGVLYRDYARADRAAYAAMLARLCRAQRRVCLIAGDARLAGLVRAHGVHWPEGLIHRVDRRTGGLQTAAAHSVRAANQALARGADAVLVSPVFATRSHPGAGTLGPHRLARMLRFIQGPVYPLGGITAATARRLPPGLAGLAAIDAFAPTKAPLPCVGEGLG